MSKTNQIRKFLLENLSSHQKDIIKAAIHKFGLSRQGILKHMNNLIREDRVVAYGKTRDRYYELKPLLNFSKSINILDSFDPDLVLKEQVSPNLKIMPQNIREICQFSLGALFYNVLYHSNASQINYKIYISSENVHLIINDNGIGIFSGIAKAFNFNPIQVAAVEIAKGYITSDPKNHAGDDLKAVFNMFDKVKIASSGIMLSYSNINNDWNIEDSKQTKGTRIHLEIRIHSRRTCSQVFDSLFNSKVRIANIPVKLAKSKGVQLNTRKDAHSLLHNIKDLKEIQFDFNNIDIIGPAFADELVRKSIEQNKAIDIKWVNSSTLVDALMSRAVNRIN